MVYIRYDINVSHFRFENGPQTVMNVLIDIASVILWINCQQLQQYAFIYDNTGIGLPNYHGYVLSIGHQMLCFVPHASFKKMDT